MAISDLIYLEVKIVLPKQILPTVVFLAKGIFIFPVAQAKIFRVILDFSLLLCPSAIN